MHDIIDDIINFWFLRVYIRVNIHFFIHVELSYIHHLNIRLFVHENTVQRKKNGLWKLPTACAPHISAKSIKKCKWNDKFCIFTRRTFRVFLILVIIIIFFFSFQYSMNIVHASIDTHQSFVRVRAHILIEWNETELEGGEGGSKLKQTLIQTPHAMAAV